MRAAALLLAFLSFFLFFFFLTAWDTYNPCVKVGVMHEGFITSKVHCMEIYICVVPELMLKLDTWSARLPFVCICEFKQEMITTDRLKSGICL